MRNHYVDTEVASNLCNIAYLIYEAYRNPTGFQMNLDKNEQLIYTWQFL